MAFSISETAISFIKKRGVNEVTINVIDAKAGCVGSFKEIEVKLGKPRNLEKFDMEVVGEITIYYPKSNFMKEGEFILTLEGVLFLKQLVLKRKD